MWTLDAETRRRYVHGMTRLGVWYARALLEQGKIGSEELPLALCKRVDLYRFTDLWNGGSDVDEGLRSVAWMECAERIAGWMRDTPIGEVTALEDRVLQLLDPLLERRLPKDVGPPPSRPFECWTYELGWEGLADGPGIFGKLTNGAHVNAIVRRSLRLKPSPSRDGVLHIMNVKVPRSFLEDMDGLADSLRALIASVRREQPQVRELWCNTWLNEHPRFQEIFPEAWLRNGVVAPPGNFRNWWGQFARRDGDFNVVAAEQFRASGGVFPFHALQCHAPIEEIDEHLRRRFDPKV